MTVPILVRNLPRSLTESELEALVAPFGKVTSCDLVIDQQSGQSKGFGFVEFDSEDSINNAIAGLNATKLQGKKIRVKWSNQDAHQTQHTETCESSAQEGILDRESRGRQVKNAWDSARPRVNDEPGEYD